MKRSLLAFVLLCAVSLFAQDTISVVANSCITDAAGTVKMYTTYYFPHLVDFSTATSTYNTAGNVTSVLAALALAAGIYYGLGYLSEVAGMPYKDAWASYDALYNQHVIPTAYIPTLKYRVYTTWWTSTQRVAQARVAAATAYQTAMARAEASDPLYVARVAVALGTDVQEVYRIAAGLNIKINAASFSQLDAMKRAQASGGGAYNQGRYIGGPVGAISGGGWRL